MKKNGQDLKPVGLGFFASEVYQVELDGYLKSPPKWEVDGAMTLFFRCFFWVFLFVLFVWSALVWFVSVWFCLFPFGLFVSVWFVYLVGWLVV